MAETLEQETITKGESSPFKESSWTDTFPTTEEKVETALAITEAKPAVVPDVKPTVAAQPEVKVEETKEVIFDEDKYVKEKWGWDNAEAGKKEIESLKERASALDLTNEESKKVLSYIKEGKTKDLYKFLHQQEEVERLATSDLTNEKTATELVKFGISNKNKNLSPEEVDFLYNRKFNIPSKPIQDAVNETDDEYAEKVIAWEGRVKDIKTELVIEAKLAQPELEKLKTELVLPDIQKPVDLQAQQKELQRAEAATKKYLDTLESDFKKFNGYEIKYKDEEVEIPVSFTISEEDRVSLKNELKDFDPIGFIDSRWFDKDGTPNILAIMDDMTLLRKKEVVLQKMVNEIGSKIREHYIKIKGQVSVNGSQQGTLQPDAAKSNMDQQIEYLWKQK